jgi:hypothetical protein
MTQFLACWLPGGRSSVSCYYNLFDYDYEINVNKTTALVINGSFRHSLLPAGIKITVSAKICGVFFGQDAVKLNEAMLLTKMEKTIQGLQGLSYTLHLFWKGSNSQYFHFI